MLEVVGGSRMTPDRARKFISIASAVAQLSKDPSTKVGAVALSSVGAVLSVGYNGFPRGMDDSPERYNDRSIKLAFVVHAEQNLVAQAAREGVRLAGCTIVISGLFPCSSCAKSLIQAGVVRVITPPPREHSSWKESNRQAMELFKECGVVVNIINRGESE